MSELATSEAGRNIRNRSLAPAQGWLVAAALLFGLFLLAGGPALLSDPDTQWHIAVGRSILDRRAFPHTDMLSHTFAGQPWLAKEWLSQVAYALAYEWGGWSMVALLPVLACIVTFWLVMKANAWRHSLLPALTAGLTTLLIVDQTVVARPHVLAFPLIALWTLVLINAARTTGRPPWPAIALMVLWANLHAGFTMGFVIAGAFGIEALMRASPENRGATALAWLGFGICTVIATTITPYGLSPLLINFRMAAGNEAMQFIGEWAPLGPQAALLTGISATLLIGVMALDWRQNLGRILLTAFLTYAMIRHIRFAMVFGIVVPMIAFLPVAAFIRRAFGRFSLFQTLPTLSARFAPVVTGIAAGALLTLAVARPVAPPLDVGPNAALAAVPADVRSQPVFNTYNLGGFLAFNGVPTFIDGRSDQLFLGGFITEATRATRDKTPEALSRIIERYNIGWAIVNSRMGAATVLAAMPGWRELPNPESQEARVFVRTGPL